MKKIALFTTLMFASMTALAFHCPADMKKIDAAMAKNPELSESDRKAVKNARKKGEELHKEGKHQESVDELAKAMKILKIDGAAKS